MSRAQSPPYKFRGKDKRRTELYTIPPFQLKISNDEKIVLVKPTKFKDIQGPE